jgi:PAS domain S-box-containing protein
MPYGDKIRIAVIDDDEADYFIITDYISEIEGKTFTIDWYKDYADAIEKIKSKSYHLYFVDYYLGSKTGLDFLKEAASLKCDDPIVLLTGYGNKSIDVSAMQNGATDYLVKSDLTTEKLERCIRYSLERAGFLRELKARENKYRNLFQGSKDAVFIANHELSFIESNQAALSLLSSLGGSLAGRHLYDFIPDNAQKEQISQLLKTQKDFEDLDIKIQTDDKEVKDGLLSLFSLQQNGEEQEPLIHGIIHDITNIKKAEMANLQAEKLAANERLIRMLAHEIRNPLNNILLSVGNLVPTEGDDMQKDFLDIIQRNSIRINQIITELLNLAKPGELRFEEYSLQEIMDESFALASDRISLQKINVEKKYPPYPLMIAADKSKLVIAFTNILINAVEAMETNGNLSVDMMAAPESYNVCIRDNGVGIPQEYISKLFEPFFTLKKNGMGLGLTASYSIMQSHHAKMQVESNVNRGTAFTIRFKKTA